MLQVKDNQRNLHLETATFFHKTYRDTPQALEDLNYEEIDKSNGRVNELHYRLLPITGWLSGTGQWKGCQSLVEVSRIRSFKKEGKVQVVQEVFY